jgi:hypothetical protein
MKFRPVGVKLFHADGLAGQTDMTKLGNSRFSQFCEIA